MRVLPLFTAICVAPWLFGCLPFQSNLPDQVLAKVNGEPIAAEEFLFNLRQLRQSTDKLTQDNPRVSQQLKTRAFNETVLQALLRQEAAKRDIRVAPAEVEGRLTNWKDGYPPGGFEEMLQKQNTTEAYLKKRIADQLLVERLVDELFQQEALVSDEEMKDYYGKHQSEFYRPAQVHVFQIVVPSREEAEKIRQEVVSDVLTFESAARKYSLSPDAAKGGDLGFFSKNEKIAAFNRAFAQKVGTISQPIRSRYGVHLLKVVEKKPAKKLSYGGARNEIQKALKRSKEITAYKDWVAKLLKDGEIYQNEVVFNNVQ